MKFYFLIIVFFVTSSLGFCQSTKTEEQNKEIVIAVKENNKYNITAIFHGLSFRYGENDEVADKIITYIVFQDNNTGKEMRYNPPDIDTSKTSGTDSIITPDFYFVEVWSPNEEYLILPIGKFEGFGIFEAKNAVNNIKSKKYLDTLKVKSENSGWFWHNFEKWEDDSTFSFRAGLDGDMFAFKYDLKKSELYCYEGNCADSDIGINNKGKIRAVKKGDIAPIKMN